MKKFAIVLILCIVLASSMAFAQDPVFPSTEPTTEAKVADCVIVRPLCAAGSIVSTAVYIALSPVLYICGIGEPAARVMVEAPWRYTSMRPLGDFSGRYKDGKPITIIEDN